ncbi:MAG: ABC transporter ATP-binding protein [Vicinamibacterales bacterium]|jgi:sodium transport system ATP-binding protein|nr:ABC transporter ATP-binding protein [Vicinamibacterales bacterium]
MPTLLARHLVKRFPGVAAVDDVSLEVEAGEVVGLLGPNGAGKTTTLRMLAGILTPDEGQVTICGLDLQADPLAAKQRLGFLSGDTQLYQRLSPVEVLRYFGELYGMRGGSLEARIRQLVADLDMAAFATRPCGTLSSGQKQRANIARAFLHDPELLILDEPTTALDVISGQFIVEAIRREKAAGRAVLFSTHIMGEAEYLCDRIYLLHAGRIVDAGPLADLLERSGQPNLTDAFLHHAGRAAGAA